ncbi:silencing defective 5 [Euphorbia peplus]|nr:silencing defective 5 [Euphorbia peplus]
MDNDLKELVEVFGCEFSLEDIASAYRQTRQDKSMAAEILCTMHGTSVAAENTSALDFPSSETSTSPVHNLLDEASCGQQGGQELMSKRSCASMGNVSTIIGKEYASPRPLRYESVETKKPLKLHCEEYLPVYESWEEIDPSIMTNCAHADVEEFLFKMLGEGFQLDRHKIQEVLGLCGYDMQKSVDELLDLSAVTMERREDAGMADSVQGDGATIMSGNFSPKAKGRKAKTALEKELLHSLFDLPGRCVEAPTRTLPRKVVKKPKRFGKLVVEALHDGHMQDMSSTEESLVSKGNANDDDDDNSYNDLREAVKEYWITTKEYYKAAITAFTQGDHARANKLLEQGQFFNQRAREMDAKSCEKLLETREDDEAMFINLHDLGAKEAVQILRLHLGSLSGIPGVKYLRLLVNRSDDDSTKGARKKLQIVKQLEKEGIKWEEEENGRRMLIKVDEIDPKSLSFAKKEGNPSNKSPDLGYYF